MSDPILKDKIRLNDLCIIDIVIIALDRERDGRASLSSVASPVGEARNIPCKVLDHVSREDGGDTGGRCRDIGGGKSVVGGDKDGD
jgi:hypothetical protein